MMVRMEEARATEKDTMKDKAIPPAQLSLGVGIQIKNKRVGVGRAKRLTQASRHGPLGP